MTALLERLARDAPESQHSAQRVTNGETPFWTTDRLLGLGLATLGATVVAWGIGLFPGLLGDEGIYTDQAQSVLHGQISPYTYTYDHPFFGWFQISPLLALARQIDGNGLSVVDARAAMVPFVFISLVLLFHIGRRIGLGRGYAAAAVVLLSLSPLFIVNSREVLLDNVALPWVLWAFYLALNPKRRQWTYGLAGMAFGVAVLSKETVLLVLPALVYIVWTRAYGPIRPMAIAAFATLGTLMLSIYPLFALLRNELLPGSDHVSLWANGIVYQLADRNGSGALWQAGSSRRQLVDGWLATDPLLLLVGCAAAIVCLFVRRLRFAGLALVLWAVPVVKPGGYLPAMYVVLALPFCALAVVGLAHASAQGVGRFGRRGGPRIAVAVLGLALGVLTLTYYVPQDRDITTNAANNQLRTTVEAEAYVRARLARDTNVLVDPVFWTDLVEDGFDHPWHGVIAYYQFDLDPLSSKRYLPQGWQDIDYVVETTEMADNVQALGLARLQSTLEHSKVIASFGTDKTRVLIRKVEATKYNREGK